MEDHNHARRPKPLSHENKALLPLYVAHGITTIHDASGDLPEQVLAGRSEIADGALFGPTLLSSGPKIEGIKPVWKGTLESQPPARCGLRSRHGDGSRPSMALASSRGSIGTPTLHDRAALDRMLTETRAKVSAWNAQAANN